jgi:hypothetical protein
LPIMITRLFTNPEKLTKNVDAPSRNPISQLALALSASRDLSRTLNKDSIPESSIPDDDII